MKHCLVFIVVVFAGLLFSSQILASNILVIQSYHKDFQWDKDYTSALRDELSDKYKLRFFRMDTKRLPKEKFKHRADLAWEKYLKHKPDCVVLGDDNALKYLGERLGGTSTPVVFLGINGNPRLYFKDKRIPSNITGVLERPLFASSIKKAKVLVPDLKRVLILFDDGHTSKAALSGIMREINSIDKKELNLEYEIKFIGKQAEWFKTVKNAKNAGYGAIFLGTYHTITDKKGRHIPSTFFETWTSKNSEVPVFGFWSISVGKGKAIGGIVLDGYKQGKMAAEMVHDVVSGKQPQIQNGVNGVYLFSKAELERWRIKLPLSLEKKATFVD